jgi:hypothetical protein
MIVLMQQGVSFLVGQFNQGKSDWGILVFTHLSGIGTWLNWDISISRVGVPS